MKLLKDVINKKYKSYYAASAALEVHAHQLKRWCDKGAMVDENGDVYIKSRKVEGLKNVGYLQNLVGNSNFNFKLLKRNLVGKWNSYSR